MAEKTLYTMAEIKEAVRRLMWAAINDFDKGLEIQFKKEVEESDSLMFDIKKFESLCSELNSLEKKYINEQYNRHGFNPSSLKDNLKSQYKGKFYDEKQKIKDQFSVIINRLSIMRNPNTALEFLKACGIALPDKLKPIINIPVDPEFIKNVLPKCKMLGSGEGEP